MARKKLRPLGEILLDLEPLILELTSTHDLQWGDVLNLVRGYLEVHCPEAQEEYTEGGKPVFYYGPSENIEIPAKVREALQRASKKSVRGFEPTA